MKPAGSLTKKFFVIEQRSKTLEELTN